jgi:hypothetical protein
LGLASLLVWSLASSAFAIDFIGKVAVGRKSSELIIRDRVFDPEFITLDLSLTGSIGRSFVSFNNEVSIKDDVQNESTGLVFYSREDTNITFGYGFDSFSAFAGFRKGETAANDTASNNAFGTRSDGYYLGVSSSYYFEGKGSLTGSIAIADLDGEVSLSEPLVDTTAFTVTSPPDTIKGSAIGYSLAIGWQGEVSPDTLYNIDLKINQFDFEDDVVFGGVDLSYEENFSTFSIGLTHFF